MRMRKSALLTHCHEYKYFSSEDYQIIKAVRDNLISIGGVDAVLISHADMQHMSALPIICGTKGEPLNFVNSFKLNYIAFLQCN